MAKIESPFRLHATVQLAGLCNQSWMHISALVAGNIKVILYVSPWHKNSRVCAKCSINVNYAHSHGDLNDYQLKLN